MTNNAVGILNYRVAVAESTERKLPIVTASKLAPRPCELREPADAFEHHSADGHICADTDVGRSLHGTVQNAVLLWVELGNEYFLGVVRNGVQGAEYDPSRRLHTEDVQVTTNPVGRDCAVIVREQ